MKNLLLAAAAAMALSLPTLRAADCACARSPGKISAASASDFPGSVPILLSGQSVRSELALTKSQCAKLDAIRADYRSDARRVTAKFPESAAGRKAANESVRQLTSESNSRALAVLTPAQRERLDQIGHQKLGGLMLFIPRVREKLSLSKDQTAVIARLRADADAYADKVNRSFEEGEIGLRERLASLRAWRERQSKKILGTLTADQKKLLERMRGQPVKPS
jgi:Spy/CpxP family protein refolding chaperone